MKIDVTYYQGHFPKKLTEGTIDSFNYDLKGFEHKPNEFNDYDVFFTYSTAVGMLGVYEQANTLRAIEEWHEDDGNCLWWNLPINEPPYCGTPLDENFPEYKTHYTEVILPIIEGSSDEKA